MSDYSHILQREIETKKDGRDVDIKDGKTTNNGKDLSAGGTDKQAVFDQPSSYEDELVISVDSAGSPEPPEASQVDKEVEIKEKKKVDKPKKREKIPVWISLTDAASLGGVQSKTLRRAIKLNKVKYKITHNRYSVEFESLIFYFFSTTKLKNKFTQLGIGQYIDSWKTKYRI